jgi:hypothetical protein
MEAKEAMYSTAEGRHNKGREFARYLASWQRGNILARRSSYILKKFKYYNIMTISLFFNSYGSSLLLPGDEDKRFIQEISLFSYSADTKS